MPRKARSGAIRSNPGSWSDPSPTALRPTALRSTPKIGSESPPDDSTPQQPRDRSLHDTLRCMSEAPAGSQARDTLIERLRAALEPHSDVLDAYLFGSQARGDAAATSDVDVAVYVDPAALERPGFGLDAELGSALQTALSRSDVDVVILNRAPPLLYRRVLRDGVRLLSRSEPATVNREG